MSGIKSSNAEIEDAVNRICKLMIGGLTRTADILNYIEQMDSLPKETQKEVKWKPIEKGYVQLNMYIQQAWQKFKESHSKDMNTLKKLYSDRLDELYRKAVKDGKIQTANNIVKNQMWLESVGGLNIKSKVDITNFDVKLSPEEDKAFKDRTKDIFGTDFVTVDTDND